MQADLLQQLRDVHLPADPSSWPPAIGWWMLAILLSAGLVMLVRWLVARIRRQQPLKQARHLYDTLYSNYQLGLVDPQEFLHQANELLKRLMIHGLGKDEARKANDTDWLLMLDAVAGHNQFSDGPGQALGNQRFSANAQADVDKLNPLLQRFFKKVWRD